MNANVAEIGSDPAAEVIPYRIASAQGVSAASAGDRHTLTGAGGFSVVLTPVEGDAWDLTAVSVLGLMLKNTGETDLILDTMVGNDGATGWSNSALGRTIVKPGEELPLGVALCRSIDYAATDPAYLRMSGLPNGRFRHWHTFDPSRARNFVIRCHQAGGHSFELAQMFPLQKMRDELLGVFPFIDKYGQYILKEWPGKVRSDDDIRAAIAAEKKLEAELGSPAGRTQYGGWKDGPKLEATGFFRTQKVDGRWWFVDPEGRLFWSYGVNCVGVEFAGQTPTQRNPAVFEDLPPKDDPEFGRFCTTLDVEDNYRLLEDVPHVDFTRANLFRKYGEDWKTRQIEQDAARMKYCRFNTIGAWSDSAVTALKQVPYTVMLHYEYAFAAEKLPDPFAPETRAGIRKAIEEYPVDFKNDPWCLGVFVNNELHWNNDSRQMIAAVMGYRESATPVKKVFLSRLTDKYKTAEALNAAWETEFQSLEDLLTAHDPSLFRDADKTDCSELAFLLADAFYGLVKQELETYSPNILYLGSRMNGASPAVLRGAAKHVDVISANIYSYQPNAGSFGNTDKPVLISEFHYANVSGKCLGSGLRSAQDGVQQARLLKEFIAGAVQDPNIIGAHWFQWRDQNVGGRYDGENYDIGFFDVADIPNEELIRAAVEAGQNLYKAEGK